MMEDVVFEVSGWVEGSEDVKVGEKRWRAQWQWQWQWQARTAIVFSKKEPVSSISRCSGRVKNDEGTPLLRQSVGLSVVSPVRVWLKG